MVVAWLGNSAPIAARHYLQVTDADFDRASGSGAKSRRSQFPPTLANCSKKHVKPWKTKACVPSWRKMGYYPLGESNPCSRTENPMSWATRRRGPDLIGSSDHVIVNMLFY